MGDSNDRKPPLVASCRKMRGTSAWQTKNGQPQVEETGQLRPQRRR